jgi:hypothetical protein
MTATLAAIALLACTDRKNPVAPDPGGPGTPAPGASIGLAMLDCSANVRSGSVVCRKPENTTGGARGDIIYGGQDIYVSVTTSSVDYNPGTQKFTFNLRLRNLLRQAIGTSDGLAADPAGVKVFFAQNPTVTGGTGVIAVDNADGTATFTAANQPYYTYVQLLDEYALSANKLWQFSVPTTVATFDFKLFISSPVQFPTGWIDVSEPTYTLRRTYTRTLFGIVRDQYGAVIPGATIAWSSANGSIATVAPDGTVTGALPGTVNIIANSTNDVPGTPGASQGGAGAFTITGTSLTWTAGAATTDWNTAGNWDRGVSPVAQDSATIPVLGSAIYPVLTGNQSIGAVTVADAAQLSLGAFDLTVSQDALAGLSGGIVASTGRIMLTGTAKTVAGVMPRQRVSGTYNLAGNVNGVAPLRVEGGRMRSTSFRVRLLSQ